MHLWLRAETKPNEKRAALTPSVCKKLTDAGFNITIEESNQSIFNTDEYSPLTIVPAGSWKNAPKDALIIGLKELPEEDTPLTHDHIMFAHCFKQQAGWKDILNRFNKGNGTLYDLEFLNDTNGRRVAAFGYYAGFAGCAMGLDVWCHKHISKDVYRSPAPFDNEEIMISEIKKKLSLAANIAGKLPSVMVMGALGRCGSGACDLARKVGIPEENIRRWDMKETAKGGPFTEIAESDIFVNCIYLSSPIPPFLTAEMLNKPSSILSVLVDVSCDPNNPNNPLPIYNASTTFDDPIVKVGNLDIVAIDHLPSLLPREASERFCSDLLSSLLELKDGRVWTDARNLYLAKVKEMNA